jgi:hypothetical protein
VKRSIAESAYHGNACPATARQRGAAPVHCIEKIARDFSRPETLYQKMANFTRHWPNQFASLGAKHNHAETPFSMMEHLFGYRLRCRFEIGRENEVQAKISMSNLFLLTRGILLWNDWFSNKVHLDRLHADKEYRCVERCTLNLFEE